MRIQGDLATYEFSDLLQWLAQGCKTGVLNVTDGDVEYQLGFDRGRIDMSSSNDPDKRLDGYLYRKGLIDKATLERGERLREATHMMSGQVLVTLGAVSEMQLAKTLRERTEEILCELLTWDRGTFEFIGGERPENTMVPISLEVTKLLLESMHRLDQSGRGSEAAPGAGAPVVAEAAGRAAAPDATQAIEGLALAEVLQPGARAEPVPAAFVEPAAQLPGGDLPPPYAVMAQAPGSVRRLAPYALVVTLSFLAGGFYLANIEASAEAVGIEPAGQPILFTPTSGPPPRPTVATVEPAAGAAVPARAEDLAAVEEALRRQYEDELASLRQELEEARRLAEASGELPVAADNDGRSRPAGAPGSAADAEARALDARAAPPAEPAPPPPARETPRAATAQTPGATPPLPSPSRDAAPSPARPKKAAATPAETAAQAAAVAAPVEVVGPKLLERPVPRYPVAAQRHKRGATIMLRVLVGTDGRVEEVARMGAKAGMGFDRAAEEAAMESTWEPGTRDGAPEAMWAALRFEFKP